MDELGRVQAPPDLQVIQSVGRVVVRWRSRRRIPGATRVETIGTLMTAASIAVCASGGWWGIVMAATLFFVSIALADAGLKGVMRRSTVVLTPTHLIYRCREEFLIDWSELIRVEWGFSSVTLQLEDETRSFRASSNGAARWIAEEIGRHTGKACGEAASKPSELQDLLNRGRER